MIYKSDDMIIIGDELLKDIIVEIETE